MTGFEVYRMYVALKQHFTKSSYDYFKYHGKVRVKEESFAVRKDRFFFTKMSKKFQTKPDEIQDYIVANMVHDPGIWIGNMVGVQADKVYSEWKKRQQSFSYQLESEVCGISDSFTSDNIEEEFNNLFVCSGGQHPELLTRYNQGDICLETLICFDVIFNCFGKWNADIQDTVIWPDIYSLCRKYVPFLSIDKNKCQSIMVKCFN
jgi:hypothetical protein